MEGSEIKITGKDRIAIEKYKRIVNGIIKIKELLQKYKEDHNSLKEKTYFELVKKISYLRHKQSTTSRKIRFLYIKLYKQ
jgi:hypothetical protein